MDRRSTCSSGQRRRAVGQDELTVRSRELLRDVRDRVWREVVLAEAPAVGKYADKAGRTIPLAQRTPMSE